MQLHFCWLTCFVWLLATDGTAYVPVAALHAELPGAASHCKWLDSLDGTASILAAGPLHGPPLFASQLLLADKHDEWS
jgi:hypothetical protein